MGRATSTLTARERAVMERIDRRVPIKVIAAKLGVSETRINQHIRALKDHYGAANLGELVDRHRERCAADEPASIPREPAETPLPKDVCSNAQLDDPALFPESPDRVANGEFLFADSIQVFREEPWVEKVREDGPHVVPGLLDGPHPGFPRLLAIVAMAFAILAALVLSLVAARTVSEVMDGWGSVPATQTNTQPAG